MVNCALTKAVDLPALVNKIKKQKKGKPMDRPTEPIHGPPPSRTLRHRIWPLQVGSGHLLARSSRCSLDLVACPPDPAVACRRREGVAGLGLESAATGLGLAQGRGRGMRRRRQIRLRWGGGCQIRRWGRGAGRICCRG
jgi:hypothetical protein